jgi:predicted Zn-dependent peptidase
VQSLTVSEAVMANGMRLVELPVSGRLAAALAVVFPAGARQEGAGEVGAAHLLEHLAFKGTAGHPTASELNRAAEYLGTELDGISTTEYVEFSTVVRAESVMPAAELLTDLAGSPRLAEADLDSERLVILQEIADSDEDPGSRADDLLTASLYAGHRLATSVLGTATDVRQLTRAALVEFRERQWSPVAGLVAVAGNLDHLDRDRLTELIGRIPARPAPAPAPPPPPFAARAAVEERDGSVVHLRLAYQVPGLDFRLRRDRAVAEVLSQLVGGPMGSRLFDELREQHSLCYWVDAGVSGFEDRACLFVGCSVSPSDLRETYERIGAILDRLRADGPSDEEARRFSAYSSGAVALSFESVSARLNHAIELIMEYGDHAVDPILLLRQIESVTGSELAELAARIEPGPCVGCVGPAETADFA